MSHKKTREQISYNMSQVRNKNTDLENAVCSALIENGITTFTKNDKSVTGHPDITFRAKKIAIFCDGDFWHGYNWETSRNEIKSNQKFWIDKIERNICKDKEVTAELQAQGWKVIRFWGHEIKKELSRCVDDVLAELRRQPSAPYKVIDLCAGIGGIRKGFEMTGSFENVLSAEVDKYACATYKHIFGEDPYNDITSDEFKSLVEQTRYDVLLAGFPCQSFSGVGLKKGFSDEEKGQIFFHIAYIIKETRPTAFFLENVDRLVTHDKGETFRTIMTILINECGYHVVGATVLSDGTIKYEPKNFVRNSRNFGMPQNRPRTYLMGFDTERFSREDLACIPGQLPESGSKEIYTDLRDVLEHDVDANYYLGSKYFQTLIDHRKRQEEKGYGFGYRIVNEPEIEHPIANTLLATGGSGRERNLIYDPQEGIAGLQLKRKKSPLNDKGIRIMTPSEWGKLQGFVNYAFLDADGNDQFSFPENVPNVQRYKQFGNSVTIPVIEEMAYFMLDCFEKMKRQDKE